MKTQDLIIKANKDLNSLTLFELRRLAQIVWKEDCFKLNKLVEYCHKTEDQYLNLFLSKAGLTKESLTVKFVLENANEKLLNTKAGEKKMFHSLWLVTGSIQNFAAKVQAKAQLNSKAEAAAKKAEDKKANAIEPQSEAIKEAEAAAKKTEKVVTQNKRLNANRKAEAAAKTKAKAA
jgi:chemotaxis protein histidine kinase CheA